MHLPIAVPRIPRKQYFIAEVRQKPTGPKSLSLTLMSFSRSKVYGPEGMSTKHKTEKHAKINVTESSFSYCDERP
ncbi:unnamed protein product [Lasius platythorax]|uniref:Uncharacterized protein n=1 Tax=Lasius platythorax TaxID=488582 RepID=A0AAV2PA41_9HYME